MKLNIPLSECSAFTVYLINPIRTQNKDVIYSIYSDYWYTGDDGVMALSKDGNPLWTVPIHNIAACEIK